MPVRAAAGGGDGRGSAEGGEGRLGPQAFGIASGRDQQLGGGVGADAVGGPQTGVVGGDLAVEGPGQGLVFGGEFLDAPGEALQRGEDRCVDRVPGRSQPCQGVGPVGSLELPEPGADALGCGDEDVGDLVEGGGAGLDGGAGGVVKRAYAGGGVVLGCAGGPSGQGGA
ncbi:hypothetical protein ABZS99_41540 [Streptomyces sp. NPDC005463]|uniref:hypothetical protein n=1 Tax=Streptomyces sp. NPDC005463 TaxID=3154465 RepID=UPI0033B2866A